MIAFPLRPERQDYSSVEEYKEALRKYNLEVLRIGNKAREIERRTGARIF